MQSVFKLLTAQGNSTLTRHFEKSCPGLRFGGDSTQTVLDNHGRIWTYDVALQRAMTTKCVIQMGLPFGAFDNPHNDEFDSTNAPTALQTGNSLNP